MHRFALSPPLSASRRARMGPARGEALQSLSAAEGLRDRFCSWRGVSGRRYVCSVFQAGEARFVAEVTEGLIVGVVRDGAWARAVSLSRACADIGVLREAAREFGVTEWHVLFGASDEAAQDLAASLLN